MFKALGKFYFLSFTTAILAFGMSSANAGVILSAIACDPADVVAGAPVSAASSQCLGLYDHQAPGLGPNDSESFFNNQLTLVDLSVAWGASGAFGINTWDFLGKDEQTSFSFINVTSGNPATWVTSNPLLDQPYLFAAKQSGYLGLYYFSSLAGVSSGTVDFNAIFGDGITDDGWSHFSIYTSPQECEEPDDCENPFPVPEPGLLSLLGLGLLGLGLSRRRLSA